MKAEQREEQNVTERMIAVGLTPAHWEYFNCIRDYYGLQTNASVLRMLIVQKGRAIERIIERKQQNGDDE